MESTFEHRQRLQPGEQPESDLLQGHKHADLACFKNNAKKLRSVHSETTKKRRRLIYMCKNAECEDPVASPCLRNLWTLGHVGLSNSCVNAGGLRTVAVDVLSAVRKCNQCARSVAQA